MSILTVPWDRGERIGFMPRESDLVYADPALTVLWRPMTTATIIDFDLADLAIPPGANPAPPGGNPGGGYDEYGEGGFGPPSVFVVKRRTENLFLKNGLVVDLDAPAPATVKAVLTAKVAKSASSDKRPRRVKISATAKEEIGTERSRLRLRSSAAGRRVLRGTTALPCTLELVIRYADQDPLELKRSVKIVERKR